MRVILTHEQADFDALASQLAANLLDESAWSVLPRRMNRNVRAFITIYGAELPFIEARDVPAEPVDELCLVDTQGMVTIKGFNPSTRVRVIDHHPRREDLPGDWLVHVELTGATTTLLTEALQEQNGSLNPVHATLLLLGIYEDTGSLTYSRTTPRDLQAAAFLLTQGASLRIANNFLNHPLSLAQQSLYDELRSSAVTHKINGHTVILSTGDAQNMDEELSSVVHKIRDLLEPDALIVLISTRGGIQMIARSTSDYIDVSEVAGIFGGGGHDRAAAALIRERTLKSVVTELQQKLPAIVRPAVTVDQIMSYGLQVLSPETPVHAALERMQRYGFEGYPVVENGKVVGLLTRRAVDRAVSHRLNLPAASLMDSGNVVVHPDDSLERLQRVMADSGWGQIPVVDSKSGAILGIVTRTDLLKTLVTSIDRTERPNLTARLEAVLPKSRLVLLSSVAQTAYEKHLGVYIVGGFVRDLLLDHPSLDFDIVVEGDAVSLAKNLVKKYGGRITRHAQFGTAKWYLDASIDINKIKLALPDVGSDLRVESADLPPFLDLITARREFYTHPTALPTVESGSIKFDLHRRDFTINTLALRLDGHHFGELHDYWGGLSDLRQGLVRVLHSLSFVDDPTRVLRAVRFEQRFGFQIEPRTLQLIQEAQSMIAHVSGDRLRHELNHILDETKVVAMLVRLHGLNLFSAIHPDLNWDKWLKDRLEKLPQEISPLDWGDWVSSMVEKQSWQAIRRLLAYCLWMMRLPAAQRDSIFERLHYPRREADTVRLAGNLWQDLPDLLTAPPSQIAARLDPLPPLSIYACCLAADDKEVCGVLNKYLSKWRGLTPSYTGDNLRQRGLPPGPVYKHILTSLRAAWLDGLVQDGNEETALFENLLSEAFASKEKL